MISVNKIRAYLFFAFFTAAFLPLPARAETPAVSSVYEVAFTYARLAGTKPDFLTLLQNDPYWKSLGDLDRLREQSARLAELADKFAAFSPTTTPLVVRTPVRVHLSQKPAALVLGYRSTNLPYFPFWDGKRILTLYTEDLPLLSVLPVLDDLALRRAGYLLDEGTTLYLDLIAAGPGRQTETLIDGEIQVLIPARIAQARLLNKGGATIWSWVNPRYDYLYQRVIQKF